MTDVTWLLVDTTGVGCHIALAHHGKITQLSDMQPQSHTKRILPMIDQLLNEAQLSVADLHGIVYTQGPGSFTGVRVGISVVQGLALAYNLPTLGVSTLLALAWQGYLAQPQAAQVAAIIDARMQQVYWGVYRFTHDRIDNQQADCLTSVAQLSVDEVDCVVGDVDLLAEQQKTNATSLSLPHVDLSAMSALVVRAVECGFLQWSQEPALPTYLRNDVAHVVKKA